jgi:hypothetical protein
MLVQEETAYTFDEVLGGSFDRVLVLVAGGGSLHCNAVLLTELMTGL